MEIITDQSSTKRVSELSGHFCLEGVRNGGDGGLLQLGENLTLYNRMGGEDKILEMTKTFFEEIAKREELSYFFENVPVAAIQLHQGKFFRVLFGPEEERPTPDELQDYMIATHVRLFRDKGLNGKHFDIVAECFVKALHKGGFSKDEIDESLAIVGPLRVAFDYGAKVALDETTMDDYRKKNAPTATMDTMRANESAVLPARVPPPSSWLVENLGGREAVRKWTCALTHRFVSTDTVLAKTFMALPYLEMEPYLHDLLETAFQDSGNSSIDARRAHTIMRNMRFPLGLTRAKDQVTKSMFQHIIQHFEEVGEELLADDPLKLEIALKQLRAYTSVFRESDTSSRKVGTETAHRLKRDGRRSKKEASDSDSFTVTTTSTSLTSGSKGSRGSTKESVGRREFLSNPIFGWLKKRRLGSISA